MEDGNAECDIYRLPCECLHLLFSLTSPRDVCRLSAVSTTFLSAAMSDVVWERLVPVDYESILSRAVNPVDYVSKRELYFRLCKPILIDNGLMSFALDKSSGAKCYMLSARMLAFAQDAVPCDLRWISRPILISRFSEVVLIFWAELKFQAKIETRMLTPRTTYAAYFIFKVYNLSIDPGFPYPETAVKLGAHVSKHTVCVLPDELHPQTPEVTPFYRDFMRRLGTKVGHPRAPWAREDGWMEMEMGEFYNDEGEDGELEMSMTQLSDGCRETGFVIEGIDIRPKK